MRTKHYTITPIGKPRMTQRDKWAKRPCVERYWDFKDECVGKAVSVPDRAYICFVIPMPKGWKKLEKAKMLYQPHTQKPDIDNLVKALLDAVHEDDSHIYEIHAKKIWGHTGEIVIGKLDG